MATARRHWCLTSTHDYNCFTLWFISSFWPLDFLPSLPNFLLLQGTESGESCVVNLSGVVKIHLAGHFISIYILCTPAFIYLSGTIKINRFGLWSPRLFFSLFSTWSIWRGNVAAKHKLLNFHCLRIDIDGRGNSEKQFVVLMSLHSCKHISMSCSVLMLWC